MTRAFGTTMDNGVFMDIDTYNMVYDSVDSYEAVLAISGKLGLPAGVPGTILDQKTVHESKSAYHRLEKDALRIFYLWKRGMPICELAGRYRCPPTLAASVVLRANGLSRKEIYDCFKEPRLIRNSRLRREVASAVDLDYFFSPKANDMHSLKGKRGEEIVSEWLFEAGISFCPENDLRARGFMKTPDFLFKEPIRADGRDVFWIESKALFGSLREHARYEKKQFEQYAEQFGCGIVVYWFGYVDDLTAAPRSYLIKDSRFFGSRPAIDDLLNFVVHW